MVKWYRKRWDDEATAFMGKQGKWRRAHGTHYFSGKVDGNIFWIFSTPRTVDGYAEVNTFSDWRPLLYSNLDKKQRKAVRDIGMLLGLTWIFEELDNEGIYGRFTLKNKGSLRLQKVIGHEFTIVGTDQKDKDGDPYFKWTCSREEFRNSDIYQRAKDSVYDF